MAVSVQPVGLKPETLAAFISYVLAAEGEMNHTGSSFLWSERDAKRTELVRKGDVVAEYWDAKAGGLVAISNGLIHDLVGALFVPSTNIQRTVALVQDYDNHMHIYKPDVIDSKLISREGDDFEVYLRLLKKKIITVVLDSYHDAQYSWLDTNRALCRSYSTRIQEVEHAGTPKETKSTPDEGYGFLWRLNSYWRFAEKDGGVFIECRTISLTRDIPTALAWVLKPIVRRLPIESLVHTLQATRDALHSETAVVA